MKRPQFLKPQERFLILDISPEGTSGLFLSVDEERNIILEKKKNDIDLKKFFRSPVRSIAQKTWEGNYFFKSHRKVIAVADPRVATTIPMPLDLSREQDLRETEVTLAEIENLIAQAMGKIFNQCRGEAAKRLDVHELDAVLVGARANYFKIDGKTVGSPVGFTGKKVTLSLELTFTRRIVFESLKQFFSSPDEFYFAESPQVRLRSLSRARALPLNLIVEKEDGMSLFVFEEAEGGYPVLYREKFPWSMNQVLARIRQELGVSNGMARELYANYCAGGFSETAARAFKKIIDPAFAAFAKEIGKQKVRGTVYLDAEYDMPFALPHHCGRTVFEHIPIEEIFSMLDFMIGEDDPKGSSEALSRYLLPFIEAYFGRSNSEINQKLRRRLHWLLT